MYAVIFRAQIEKLDDEYHVMAQRMRELAMDKYGCREFVALTEDDVEIAISYWDDQEQIKAWKENVEHLKAQSQGQSKWYKSYHVQITEVIREYGSGGV